MDDEVYKADVLAQHVANDDVGGVADLRRCASHVTQHRLCDLRGPGCPGRVGVWAVHRLQNRGPY